MNTYNSCKSRNLIQTRIFKYDQYISEELSYVQFSIVKDTKTGSIPILFEIFRIAPSSKEPERFKTEKLKQDQYSCRFSYANLLCFVILYKIEKKHPADFPAKLFENNLLQGSFYLFFQGLETVLYQF